VEYKIITITGSNKDVDHVFITYEDGSFKSFPVDESNPEYIVFLAQLEETE
jgi:hypothetical protein